MLSDTITPVTVNRLEHRSRQLRSLLDDLDLPEGRLSEAALLSIVRAVTSRQDLFSDLVVADPVTRWCMLLHERANFDVRLVAWEQNQASDWHDHGGSAGAYVVTQGALVERFERFRGDHGVRLLTRRVRAGQFASFGPSHVHDVVHDAGRPAVSVHAYSPPLEALTYYEQTRFGFVARSVVPEERKAPFQQR